jgi:hypothetical protein
MPPRLAVCRWTLLAPLAILCALATTATAQTLIINGSSNTVSGAPGESFTLGITSGPANQFDWIGLYSSGAQTSLWLDWRYLSGTRQSPSSGLTSANIAFQLPTSVGNYQIRFFSGATGLQTGTSPTISIASGGVQGGAVAFGLPGTLPVDSGAPGTGTDGPLILNAPHNCATTTRDARGSN